MRRGFTLVELLAVLTILAIILLITIPMVSDIVKKSKKSVKDENVTLYGRALEKALNDYYVKYPLKDEVTLKELEDGGFIDYKGSKVECNVVRIEDREVYLEDCKVENKHVDKTYGEYIPETIGDEDYKGYYADVDGDGTPDGVIYADLNKASDAGAQYYNSNGVYTYPAKTNLNEYTISKNKHNGNFGEKEIIKLKKDKDNPRFYVMALEDFTEGSMTGSNVGKYYWYKNAYEKMSTWQTDTSPDFGKGYENTGKIIGIWNKNGEGSYQGATQDDHDIWKHIKDKYNSKEKWYIPSRGEWAAFGDYFTNKTDLETKLTTSNYNSLYRLSGWYWSSSQGTTFSAWGVYFGHGYVSGSNVDGNLCVRFGATF